MLGAQEFDDLDFKDRHVQLSHVANDIPVDAEVRVHRAIAKAANILPRDAGDTSDSLGTQAVAASATAISCRSTALQRISSLFQSGPCAATQRATARAASTMSPR